MYAYVDGDALPQGSPEKPDYGTTRKLKIIYGVYQEKITNRCSHLKVQLPPQLFCNAAAFFWWSGGDAIRAANSVLYVRGTTVGGTKTQIVGMEGKGRGGKTTRWRKDGIVADRQF